MKRSILLPALVGGCLLLTGCVTKKQYTELQSNYDRLRTENGDLQKNYNDSQVKLAAAGATNKSLEERLAEAQKTNQDLREAYNSLKGSLDQSLAQNSQGNINISKLVDEINASNKFIKQLVEAKDKSDSLNMALTNKLTRSLTTSEKDEVDVQVIKGVVYISLADNMLYKSGSYEINERAGETLSKIAKTSRRCAPRRWFRPCKTTMASTRSASRQPAAASITPSPATTRRWANSATAARRSSSRRSSTSSWT